MRIPGPMELLEAGGKKLFPDTEYQNHKFEYIYPFVENSRVLDLGVVQHDIGKIEQDSWLHDMVVRHASSTTGIDIHEEGVEYLSNEGYNVEVANAEGFEFAEPFETVVAGEIIEHLTNLDGFLTSIEESLVPGGHLIITTPNVFFFRRVYKILTEYRPPVNPEHTCWFDEETLKQLLSRYDFEVVVVQYSSGEWRFRNFPLLPDKLRNTTIILVAKYTGE